MEGEFEEADEIPKDSYDLAKGQGSSDHTSIPLLSFQDTQFARTIAHKANYHPNIEPVVFQETVLKKTNSIMLIEDLYQTDFFKHDLSEVPPSVDPPISERYIGSPKDKPI